MSYVTGTAIGNNLTVISFSSKLHRETQTRMFFNEAGMVRPDTGDEDSFTRKAGTPIVSQEMLNGKRAQEVRVGLQLQLTRNRSATVGTRSINQYTYGTGNMIDQEEVLALSNFKAFVEQMKHATAFDVPEIQDLRTEFKMTAVAANALADWCAAEIEESRLDAIYDRYSAHVVATSLASASDPPANNQQWANRKADDAALGGSDRLTAAELRRMYAWFTVNNINPIRYQGGEYAILLCHTYNYMDLWADTEFQNSMQNGWQRASKPEDNPIFSGANAVFANICIHQYNRIRTSGTNANVRRCILLGADALAEGITSRPKLVRRKEDKYEDVFGLAVKAINGWARADWVPQSGTTLNQSLAIWGLYTNTTP